MYKRLMRSFMRVEFAFPSYLGLGIIYKIILPCIHVWRAPVYAWNSHPLPTWGQELFK